MVNVNVYGFADVGRRGQAQAAQNYENSYQNINGLKAPTTMTHSPM